MIKLGIYKHSKKGTEYKVHFVAKHSETLEDMVVYEALYDNDMSRYKLHLTRDRILNVVLDPEGLLNI